MSEKQLKRVTTVDLLEKHKCKLSDIKKLTKNLHAEKNSIDLFSGKNVTHTNYFTSIHK